jgi:hypothetical protein
MRQVGIEPTERFPPARHVGDQIPKRLARVTQIRFENSDGRRWVVYGLSDSLIKPMGRGD